MIVQSNPTIDLALSVFRPSWVRYDGIMCKANNCFLIKACDGLDPVFVKLVIGNSLVTFIVQVCNVLYFEDHYHSYAIEVRQQNQLCILRVYMTVLYYTGI